MTETKWEGRFRVAGTNHEGRSWTLAPSLVVLARQVSNLHPERQPGDGTVASERHDEVSPSSDHRPRPFSGPGVVRAIDVGEARDADPMVDSLIKSRDPRIAYVIYEGEAVYSWPHNGFPAWAVQPYRGANPHSGHFHLSTIRDPSADADTRLWRITEEDLDMTPDELRVIVRDELDKAVRDVWRYWLPDPDGVAPGVEGNPFDGPAYHVNTVIRIIRKDAARAVALARAVGDAAAEGRTLTKADIEELEAELADTFGWIERDEEAQR